MIPQYLWKYFLDRERRNSKLLKPGHPWRYHIVDLHQVHLVPGDRRARKHFREPSQYVPSGKWDWNQLGLEAGFAGNGFEQLFVGVDPRATALKCDRMFFRPLQYPCDRLRHIFHIGGLQSGETAAEHWVDWKPFQERNDSG